MIAVTSFISIALFVWALENFGILQVSLDVKNIAFNAVSVMQDKTISDEEREKIIQKSSLRLFGAFFSILLRSAAAVVVSFLPILIVGYFASIPIEAFTQFLSSWTVIGIASGLILIYYFLFKRSKSKSATDASQSHTNYNQTEQMIHKFAFGSIHLQQTGARIEKPLFRKKLDSISAPEPIFITSLPRAGTTLLLEVLSRFPSLASHTYRDMPFLLSPLLWNSFSKTFQKKGELKERAHGDGMEIGFDSPEAFEEVLWKSFWPEYYHETHIDLWQQNDIKQEATDFFTEHMKKIIVLRQPQRKQDGRYISKNNANIARIPLLKAMFPDAHIVIPVRYPLEHAGSMLRQHKNFIQQHAEEPFVKEYMSDIGHYEFGELHKPFDFPGMTIPTDNDDLTRPDYWLNYWIAAFEFLEQYTDTVTFVAYEQTCKEGKTALSALCEDLNIPFENKLDSAALLFHDPPPRRFDPAQFNNDAVERAESIYKRLTTPVLAVT